MKVTHKRAHRKLIETFIIYGGLCQSEEGESMRTQSKDATT